MNNFYDSNGYFMVFSMMLAGFMLMLNKNLNLDLVIKDRFYFIFSIESLFRENCFFFFWDFENGRKSIVFSVIRIFKFI